MVALLTQSTQQPEGAPATRLEVARAAIKLIVEPDPQRLEQLCSQLFTPEYRVTGVARQLCSVYARELKPGHFLAFTEKEVTIESIWEPGDRVIAQIHFRGRHRYSYGGRPGSDAWMEARGIVVMCFAGNRIANAWAVLQWR